MIQICYLNDGSAPLHQWTINLLFGSSDSLSILFRHLLGDIDDFSCRIPPSSAKKKYGARSPNRHELSFRRLNNIWLVGLELGNTLVWSEIYPIGFRGGFP